jgi:hypothetical protein
MTIFVIAMGVAMQVAGMMASEVATKKAEHLSTVKTAFSLGEKNLRNRKLCSKENIKPDEFGEKLDSFNKFIAKKRQQWLMGSIEYENSKQKKLNDRGKLSGAMGLLDTESNALFMRTLKQMQSGLSVQEPNMEVFVQKYKEAEEKLAATLTALKKIRVTMEGLLEDKNNEEAMVWEEDVLAQGSVVPALILSAETLQQNNGKAALAEKIKQASETRKRKRMDGLIDLDELEYDTPPNSDGESNLETPEENTEFVRRSTRPSKKPKWIKDNLSNTPRPYKNKNLEEQKKLFEEHYGSKVK